MWDCRPICRPNFLRLCVAGVRSAEKPPKPAYGFDGKLLERLCCTLPQTGALTGLRYAPTPLTNGAWAQGGETSRSVGAARPVSLWPRLGSDSSPRAH